MYSYLIPNDKIKSLDHLQILDLWDYVKMRGQNLPTTVKWESIRSMVITKQGMTLWQLSEAYLNDQEFRAIGQVESPIDLFIWVLKNCYPNKMMKIADKLFAKIVK